jgi:AraC-like DNA-binding protein
MKKPSNCAGLFAGGLDESFAAIWQQLRVVHLGAVRWAVDEPVAIERRRIQEHLILFVSKGKLEVERGKMVRELKAGGFAWITPGMEHEVRVGTEGAVFFSLRVGIRSGFDEIRADLLDAWTFPLKPISFWRSVFENTTFMSTTDGFNSRQAGTFLIRQVLSHAVRNGRTLTWQHRSMDSRIQDALGIIRREFAASLTAGETAKRVGLSPQRFRALFSKETGSTFRAVLMSRRLTRAQSLLINTDRTIQEIAAETGFSTVRYFHTCFKQHIHTTPAALRKSFA